ncbi:hypothetical protein FB446DRAFT_751147, partial [Lentinula raphanica]
LSLPALLWGSGICSAPGFATFLKFHCRGICSQCMHFIIFLEHLHLHIFHLSQFFIAYLEDSKYSGLIFERLWCDSCIKVPGTTQTCIEV